MNNKLIFCLLLICLNLYLITKNKSLNESFSHIELNVKSIIASTEEKSRKEIEFLSEIPKIKIPIIQVKEAIENDCYTFIYVYTDAQCAKCVTDDIATIKEVLDSNQVCVFPVLDRTKSNLAMINSEMNGLYFMRLDKESVVFPTVDGRNVRFMGLVNNKGRILSLVYPGILSEKRKSQYLESIRLKYLDIK